MTLVKGGAHAGERLRLIIDAMGREFDYGHGWQSEVARRTGLTATTVNQVWKHTRGAGPGSITAVCRSLGLSPEWFTARSLRSTDYRDYLTAPARRENEAAFREFVERTDIGRRLRSGTVLGEDRDRALLERLEHVDFAGLRVADASLYEELARRAVLALMGADSSPPTR